MAFVKLDELVNLHITHAIAIGHEERLIANILLDPLDTPTGHGVVAGIDHSHLPWLHIGLVNSHLVLTITIIKGDIGVVQEVVSEPLLDILLLIASADDKLSMTIVGILFHDVPKDRHATYLNHWLWFELRFLRNAGTEASGEKNDFHNILIIYTSN